MFHIYHVHIPSMYVYYQIHMHIQIIKYTCKYKCPNIITYSNIIFSKSEALTGILCIVYYSQSQKLFLKKQIHLSYFKKISSSLLMRKVIQVKYSPNTIVQLHESQIFFSKIFLINTKFAYFIGAKILFQFCNGRGKHLSVAVL